MAQPTPIRRQKSYSYKRQKGGYGRVLKGLGPDPNFPKGSSTTGGTFAPPPLETGPPPNRQLLMRRRALGVRRQQQSYTKRPRVFI